MSNHATRAHARYGASSAHRWFACPGSVRLCDGVPDRPSAAALEGTRAHELLEALLVNLFLFDRNDGVYGDRSMKRAADLWEAAPQDMRDAVHVCVDHVKEILEDEPDAVLLVEHRFEIPVAAAPGEVFGTNDVCIFVPSMRTLHVVDYKHGAGTFVPVEGNEQLRFYALGALNAQTAEVYCQECDGEGFNTYGACDTCNGRGQVAKCSAIDSICLTIVQPRCPVGEPVRSEWLSVEDVLAFGPVIGDAIARCKAPDAPLVPGEDQCRFCAAATFCPARERQALEAVGTDFGDVANVVPARDALPAPGHVTGERLGTLLDAAGVIRDWFDALEDEARRRLEAGEVVPGRKLVEAQARRQWVEKDVDEIAGALADIAQPEGSCNSDLVGLFTRRQVQTLGEVERVLKDGCHRAEARRRLDAMAYLTTKKSSGALKVVATSDPRPAVDRGAAFADVKLVETER